MFLSGVLNRSLAREKEKCASNNQPILCFSSYRNMLKTVPGINIQENINYKNENNYLRKDVVRVLLVQLPDCA